MSSERVIAGAGPPPFHKLNSRVPYSSISFEDPAVSRVEPRVEGEVPRDGFPPFSAGRSSGSSVDGVESLAVSDTWGPSIGIWPVSSCSTATTPARRGFGSQLRGPFLIARDSNSGMAAWEIIDSQLTFPSEFGRSSR